MGKPYSQDLRERVIGAMDDGSDAYEIAPLFSVSLSYIYKILARRRTTAKPRPICNGTGYCRNSPLTKNCSELVEAIPDTTIAELRLWLLSEHKIKVGNTSVWKRLRHLGLTLKKVSTGRRAGSPGRRTGAANLATHTILAKACEISFRRRDLGFDQYDKTLWPLRARRTSRLSRPLRPLEDDHFCRSSAL
jgi:transposase